MDGEEVFFWALLVLLIGIFVAAFAGRCLGWTDPTAPTVFWLKDEDEEVGEVEGLGNFRGRTYSQESARGKSVEKLPEPVKSKPKPKSKMLDESDSAPKPKKPTPKPAPRATTDRYANGQQGSGSFEHSGNSSASSGKSSSKGSTPGGPGMSPVVSRKKAPSGTGSRPKPGDTKL